MTRSRGPDGQPAALGYQGHRCRWREQSASGKRPGRPVPDRGDTAHRGRPGPDPLGLVLAAARHPAQTAGLVTAGLAAAALTARTARGCQADQRWAGWAALLIGVTSARVPGTGSSSVCEHSPGTKRVSSCTGPTRPELRADRCRRPTNREEPQSMRKTGRALMVAAMAAVVAGMSTPALAATARPAPVPRSAIAFTPGSGQSVVDWNRELITILGTPGAQPATVHPTRNFALLQAAEYDAVTSITHA